MGLIKFELYKLFKARAVFLALFCLLNLLALMIFIETPNMSIEIPTKYIKAMELKISELSLEEANEYINTKYDLLYLEIYDNSLDINSEEALEIADNLWTEYYLFKQYKEKLNKLHNYDNYLNEIKTRAETLSSVSIFENPNTFSFRNIQKTAIRYEELKGIKLIYDKSEGVKKATQSTITDILAVLSIFFICTQLITSEKDKKIVSLQRTTKNGRFHLILNKLLTLIAANLAIFVLLYGVNYIVGLFMGYGDISRAVQSVDSFYSCPFKISVKEYLIYYGVIKIAVNFVISLFILLCTIISKNVLTIYSIIIGVFGLSFLAYSLIPYSSVLSPLKYINLIYYIQSGKLLYEYVNINFFSYPINSFICFIVFTLIFLILSMIVIIIFYCNHVSVTVNRFTINLKSKGSLNIYFHETVKLLLYNNALLFLTLIIVLNSWWILNIKSYLTVEEVHYRNYMQNIQGEYTQEKYDYIQDEYNNAITLNNSMNNQSMKIAALERIKQNAEYLNLQHEQGKTYYFIYEKGYDRLTAGIDNNRDAVLSLILSIALIIMLSGLISTEHQSKMIKILNTSLKGKNELLRIKYTVSLMLSFLVYVFIYLPEYYYIYGHYGFDMIFAPVASFQHLEGLGSMSILQYLILINLIRLIGISLFIFVIIAVSRKTNIMTISVASFIFLLPNMLILIRLPIAGILPVMSMLLANVVIQSSIIYHAVIAMIVLLSSILFSIRWWKNN